MSRTVQSVCYCTFNIMDKNKWKLYLYIYILFLNHEVNEEIFKNLHYVTTALTYSKRKKGFSYKDYHHLSLLITEVRVFVNKVKKTTNQMFYYCLYSHRLILALILRTLQSQPTWTVLHIIKDAQS